MRGRQRYDEDGNLIGGKTIDMVVSGNAVYVVCNNVAPFFF